MRRYTIAADAREELKQIYRYAGQQSSAAPGILREQFRRKFQLLAAQPLLGEAREDIAPGARIFSAGNYIILYCPTSRGIEIIHVCHGAQNYPAIFHKPS